MRVSTGTGEGGGARRKVFVPHAALQAIAEDPTSADPRKPEKTQGGMSVKYYC